LRRPLASWVLDPDFGKYRRHDRVVPVANVEFLDQRLPVSRVVIIDGGHFVWEEASAQYAPAVLDSITDSWP
jgi:pimeloyl-ACP methyl ester carboxylesterase